MRAMVLEFPDDPTCDDLDRQYMLGDRCSSRRSSTTGAKRSITCRKASGRNLSPAKESRAGAGCASSTIISAFRCSPARAASWPWGGRQPTGLRLRGGCGAARVRASGRRGSGRGHSRHGRQARDARDGSAQRRMIDVCAEGAAGPVDARAAQSSTRSNRRKAAGGSGRTGRSADHGRADATHSGSG